MIASLRIAVYGILLSIITLLLGLVIGYFHGARHWHDRYNTLHDQYAQAQHDQAQRLKAAQQAAKRDHDHQLAVIAQQKAADKVAADAINAQLDQQLAQERQRVKELLHESSTARTWYNQRRPAGFIAGVRSGAGQSRTGADSH